MTRPLLARERRDLRRGLYVVPNFACPNHPGVWNVMQCPRRRRAFEEHTARIAALPPVRKP